jgi:DNA-directed RNA polymerase subunit N (RpoN/RPB10)
MDACARNIEKEIFKRLNSAIEKINIAIVIEKYCCRRMLH